MCHIVSAFDGRFSGHDGLCMLDALSTCEGSALVDRTWSDDLKHVYERQGVLDRYFDVALPCDLFRGARKGGGEPLSLFLKTLEGLAAKAVKEGKA